jgi:tetratricopeptide (TPR) repeat protein
VDKEFLFYRKLLGLNDHFTKQELKEAYRQCAGKYHPDLYVNAPAHEKQHTLDIMKQINEAYEYLQCKKGMVQTESHNSGMEEEEIYVEGTDKFFKYSLSDSLAEIGRAIHARTGTKFDLDKATWELNTGLSVSVKNLMNQHNVIYSMTTWIEGSHRRIIINRRSGNKWFYYYPHTKEEAEARAHYDKGTAYFLDKRLQDKAIAEFSAAISLDKDFTQAYSMRAMTYVLKGQFDEERKDIIEITRLDPNMTKRYYEFCSTVLNIKNRHLTDKK